MPKIDIDKIAFKPVGGYPGPFKTVLDKRAKKQLGDAVYIEVGTRSPHERVHYPDDDLHLVREGRTARWLHKSGEPYT